jgi:hemolysin activation/secretion protein
LFRDAQHRLAWAWGFDWTQTTREVLSDYLTPAPTASFSGTLSDSWQLPHHPLSAALTYQQGFPIFGVHPDQAGLAQEDAHAEFHLLKANLSYADTSHKYVIWRSDLAAQYAFEGLFSDQQFYLSDPFAIRGWSHITIAADSGVAWRNEWILRLSPAPEKAGRLSWGTLEAAVAPYLFNDCGYADSKVQHLHDFLGSAGAGIRFALGRIALDGFVAFPYSNLSSKVSSPTF